MKKKQQDSRSDTKDKCTDKQRHLDGQNKEQYVRLTTGQSEKTFEPQDRDFEKEDLNVTGTEQSTEKNPC